MKKNKIWQIDKFLYSAETKDEAIKLHHEIHAEEIKEPITYVDDDGKYHEISMSDLVERETGFVAQFLGTYYPPRSSDNREWSHPRALWKLTGGRSEDLSQV